MYSGLRAHGSLGKASSPQCGSGGLSCCATGVIQAGNFFAAGFFCLIVLARRSPFAVSPRSAIKWPPSTRAKLKSILTFAFSALQSMKILFSCEDFSQKSFASLINRARARPDFARPTSRPTPRCFFTPGQGAPKSSDGGVVLVLGISSPTYSVFG